MLLCIIIQRNIILFFSFNPISWCGYKELACHIKYLMKIPSNLKYKDKFLELFPIYNSPRPSKRGCVNNGSKSVLGVFVNFPELTQGAMLLVSWSEIHILIMRNFKKVSDEEAKTGRTKGQHLDRTYYLVLSPPHLQDECLSFSVSVQEKYLAWQSVSPQW